MTTLVHTPITFGAAFNSSLAIAPQVTDFTSGLGQSNFSMHDQYGKKVDEPIFPFSLEYRVTGEFSHPEDTFEPSYLQNL